MQAVSIDTDLTVRHTLAVFHVGDVVRKLRMEKKWTLDDLVRESGVSRGTLSLIEQGKSNTTRVVLEKVAGALGTTTGAMYASIVNGLKQKQIVDKHSEISDADLITDDVTDYKRDDIPVIQEGEASPNGLIWDAGDPRSNEVRRISRPYDFREKSAYAIELRGDSMEPILKRGMTLLISAIQPVADGDVVYVQMKSGERLIKIANRMTDAWLLTSATSRLQRRSGRRCDDEGDALSISLRRHIATVLPRVHDGIVSPLEVFDPVGS